MGKEFDPAKADAYVKSFAIRKTGRNHDHAIQA
jgi:hypothetical protein